MEETRRHCFQPQNHANTIPVAALSLILFFRGLFCNFNVIFLFSCFKFVICNVMYKKNKKKEKKRKINNKKEMFVCVCFFIYVIELYKKKDKKN